jgi:hypothetical protein
LTWQNAARERIADWQRKERLDYRSILFLSFSTASMKLHFPTVITMSMGLKFFSQSKHLAKLVL